SMTWGFATAGGTETGITPGPTRPSRAGKMPPWPVWPRCAEGLGSDPGQASHDRCDGPYVVAQVQVAQAKAFTAFEELVHALLHASAQDRGRCLEQIGLGPQPMGKARDGTVARGTRFINLTQIYAELQFECIR